MRVRMKIDMNVSISEKLWAEISKDVEPPEDGSLSELEQFVMRHSCVVIDDVCRGVSDILVIIKFNGNINEVDLLIRIVCPSEFFLI